MKRIINTLKRIYNNIKYLCTRSINIELDNNDDKVYNLQDCIDKLSKRIDEINDDIDGKCDGLESRIDEIGYDVDDMMNYDDVVDCIYDNPDNDIKDDITKLETLCDVLKANNDLLMDKNNNDIDNDMERHLLVDEVIQAIINKLERNENV